MFDRNNFVQLEELSGNETLLGKGYPEHFKNMSTQDSSTMTEAPKRSRGKKTALSNYTLSDRTYDRNVKDEVTVQGNSNNSNNRRISDSSVVESYQISTLDRTNLRESVNNSSASSKNSKSGATYDLRPVTDRNFQEQYIKKSRKAELKETNMSAPAGKDNRTINTVSAAPTVSDRYFEVRLYNDTCISISDTLCQTCDKIPLISSSVTIFLS